MNMNQIAFFDCITGQGWLTDLANRSLFLDGISDRLGKRRYRVIQTEGKKLYLQYRGAEHFSLLATCLKIVLIGSVIFPLLMILIKRRNLQQHQLILEQNSETVLTPKPASEYSFKPISPLQEFILPPEKPFIPRPAKPWPVAKPLSEIPRPVQKQEEGLLLILKDSQDLEKKVNQTLACTASPVLAAACRSQMVEALHHCYQSPFFDNGVLDMITTTIQEKKMPALDFEALLSFYRATDQLQMKQFAECRQKLLARVRFDPDLTEEQLLKITLLAQEHEDVALHIFCLNHPLMEQLKLPSEEMRSLFNSLKKVPLHFELDNNGTITATLSVIDSERLQAVQQLGIQQLTVKSLFDSALVKEMECIESLSIADQDHFQIEADLVKALLHESQLHTLKLCYCNLDETATLALAAGLRANKTLSSLILTAVGIHEKGLGEIVEALRNNCSLTFLHVSHHHFDATCLHEALKEKQTLKTLCLSKSVRI